jgi:ribonuclease P protein component
MQSARLGMVVGKKAIKRASARNRVKRIIREHFRRQREACAGTDAVVRVLGPIGREELHRQLDRLFADLAIKAAEHSADIIGH